MCGARDRRSGLAGRAFCPVAKPALSICVTFAAVQKRTRVCAPLASGPAAGSFRGSGSLSRPGVNGLGPSVRPARVLHAAPLQGCLLHDAFRHHAQFPSGRSAARLQPLPWFPMPPVRPCAYRPVIARLPRHPFMDAMAARRRPAALALFRHPSVDPVCPIHFTGQQAGFPRPSPRPSFPQVPRPGSRPLSRLWNILLTHGGPFLRSGAAPTRKGGCMRRSPARPVAVSASSFNPSSGFRRRPGTVRTDMAAFIHPVAFHSLPWPASKFLSGIGASRHHDKNRTSDVLPPRPCQGFGDRYPRLGLAW